MVLPPTILSYFNLSFPHSPSFLPFFIFAPFPFLPSSFFSLFSGSSLFFRSLSTPHPHLSFLPSSLLISFFSPSSLLILPFPYISLLLVVFLSSSSHSPLIFHSLAFPSSLFSPFVTPSIPTFSLPFFLHLHVKKGVGFLPLDYLCISTLKSEGGGGGGGGERSDVWG